MERFLQYVAFTCYFSLAAGVTLADGTFGRAWESEGLYGLLRDMGGLLGALVALLAASIAWRSIEAQIEQTRWPERRARSILRRYAEYLEARADEVSRICEPFVAEPPNQDIQRIVEFWMGIGIEARYPSFVPSISDVEAGLLHVDGEIVSAVRPCIQMHQRLEEQERITKAPYGDNTYPIGVSFDEAFRLFHLSKHLKGQAKHALTTIGVR